MKKLWIVLPLLTLANWAFGAHHFTDVYQNENGWRVDHFKAEDGALQDLVESRNFLYQAQALAFEKHIKVRFPQEKSFQFVATEDGVAPLWKVTRNWDESWEDEYAEWIDKELTKDFFVRYNLATDCADVVYALRWIFARNHNLPAAATLGGSGTIVSHLTAKKEWDTLPGSSLWYKDQRFMTALRWLLDAVYTKTLYVDAFPVELNVKTIQPGLINLIGNHSEVFTRVSLRPGDVPIEAMSSTVPQAVRVMNVRIFMDDAVTERRLGGLLRFRWPILNGSSWGIKPSVEMPHYSLSQYKKNLCAHQPHFTFCLFEIMNYTYDPASLVKRLISDLQDMIKTRTTIVNDGFNFCLSHDCTPGGKGYEDWGTPSRDKRLAKNFVDTENLSETLGGKKTFDEWIQSTTIQVPFTMGLKDFRDRIVRSLTSYDPRDSVESRWGKRMSDVEETMSRFVSDAKADRAVLISQAESCRQNAEACKQTPSLYPSLSTSEIDFGLQSRLSNYISYADQARTDLVSEFKDSWFRSPAPWDSIAQRNGDSSSRNAGHFLTANVVSDGGEDLLILDHRKLYKVSTRTVDSEREETGLYYDPSSGVYLSHDRVSLKVLNREEQVLATIPLQGYADTLPLVHFFPDGTALIGECMYDSSTCFGTKTAWTLNLKTFERGEEILFYQSFIEKNKPEAVFLSGKANYSLLSLHGDVEIQDYPLFEKPLLNAMPLGHHDYFIQTGQHDGKGFDLGFLNVKGFSPLRMNAVEYFTLNRINSWWMSLLRFYPTSEGADLEGIINVQAETFKAEAVKVSFSPSDEVRLVQSGDQVLLFDHASSRKIFQSRGKIKNIVSATQNWWSTDAGNVYDHKGTLLSSTPSWMRGTCQNSFYRDCTGANQNLFFEFYDDLRPDVHGYFRFGKESRRRVQSVYAYKIEGTDTPASVVEKGSAIPLTSRQILWFP